MTSRGNAETRERIVESAMKLFYQRGFDKVGIQDIARDAGTSAGTFYTYFSHKSDIILERFSSIDGYYQRMYREIAADGPAAGRMEEFFRRQLRYLSRNIGRETVQVLYFNQLSPGAGDASILNEDRELSRILISMIEDGQERGEFRTDIGAAELHHYILRATRGLYLDWAVGGKSVNLQKDGLPYLRRTIIEGLLWNRPHPGSSRENPERIP